MMTIYALSAAICALLPPPRVVASRGSTTELLVPVSTTLSVHLLEADVTAQAGLVAAALESDAPPGTPIDDPYGVVLWPAAQAVASSIASLELTGKRVLELGCGTGLCTLTAAARGASVLATDYREEPFSLLRASTLRTSAHLARELDVRTAVLDIKDSATPLPPAHYVVAADLLYLKSTSVALARRCIEALRSADCEAVIVGDLGRPGRNAFVEELRAGGVRCAAAQFNPIESWTAGTARHELVSATPKQGEQPGPRSVNVGLMQLVPCDLTA